MLNLAFQYNPENLRASILDTSSLSLENLWILGVLIGSLIILSLLYKTSLYVYGYVLLRKELKAKESKKNTIQELILMKSIQ